MPRTLLLLAVLGWLGSCGSQTLLVDQTHVGPKQVSYLLRPAAPSPVDGPDKGESEVLNLFIRVCDYGIDGRETGCVESLLLSNVTPQ